MPQPNPGGPNFREIAKTVTAELQHRRETLVGYDPEKIIADALEESFHAGVNDTMNRYTIIPGRACLTYTSMKNETPEPAATFTVFASDPAMYDGGPNFGQLPFGDRALIRSLAQEMLRRLDLTEKREIADRAKRGQS